MPSVILTCPDSTGPLRLVRMIERNNVTRGYTAVEANFLFAAMHLACMKDLNFSCEVCPDLPDPNDILIRR